MRRGGFETRPFPYHDDSMHVIWYDHKYIQFNVWIMNR